MASFAEIDMDDLVRFELTGRLDAAGVARIEAPLTAKLRDASRSVLVDLEKVPFIGSLGIRMLISAARTRQRTGRSMMLLGVQPQVMEVFETVALGDLIPIVATAEEARQRLSA